MRPIIKVVGGVIGFAGLAVLLALRIALAAVLSVVTPIIMPLLVLLSGGGLLVAIGFAWVGHWHDAAKGLWVCLICSIVFGAVAGLAQLVNPVAFSFPANITNLKQPISARNQRSP